MTSTHRRTRRIARALGVTAGIAKQLYFERRLNDLQKIELRNHSQLLENLGLEREFRLSSTRHQLQVLLSLVVAAHRSRPSHPVLRWVHRLIQAETSAERSLRMHRIGMPTP
jgi:hypothetical protein